MRSISISLIFAILFPTEIIGVCHPAYFLLPVASISAPLAPLPVIIESLEDNQPLPPFEPITGWAIGIIPETPARELSLLVLDQKKGQIILPLSHIQVADEERVASLCSTGDYRPQSGSNCLATTLWHLLAFYQANHLITVREERDATEILAELNTHLSLENLFIADLNESEPENWGSRLNQQEENFLRLSEKYGMPLQKTKQLEKLRSTLKNGGRVIIDVLLSGDRKPLSIKSYAKGKESVLLKFWQFFAMARWGQELKVAIPYARLYQDSMPRIAITSQVARRVAHRKEICYQIAFANYLLNPGPKKNFKVDFIEEPTWTNPFTLEEVGNYLREAQRRVGKVPHSILGQGLVSEGGVEKIVLTDFRAGIDGPRTIAVPISEFQNLQWSAYIPVAGN